MAKWRLQLEEYRQILHKIGEIPRKRWNLGEISRKIGEYGIPNTAYNGENVA